MRLQDFAFKLKHCAGSCNRVLDALSRYPTGPIADTTHELVAELCICDYIDATERCQSCWGQHNAFQTRGEDQALRSVLRTQSEQRASTDSPIKPATVLRLTVLHEAQSICPETIALCQYFDAEWGARSPKWVEVAGLMPNLHNGVFCLRKKEADGTRTDEIYVPVYLKTHLCSACRQGEKLDISATEKLQLSSANAIYGST